VNPQHLSEEAVAAFADGVLGGHARDRAARHVERCAECRQAVRVQREATFALRSAVAPPLPSSLVDRLRNVPLTTPIPAPPSALAPDGSAVLPTVAPMAALVPGHPQRNERRARPAGPRDHARPYLTAAVLVGAVSAAGALVAGAVAAGSSGGPGPGPAGTGDIRPAVQPVRHLLDRVGSTPADEVRSASGQHP
jgi:hypothetical protein